MPEETTTTETTETKTDGVDSGKVDTTFTQADIDRVVKDRLKRERTNWDKEQADAKKQADMTEAEKLKAAKDEAEGKVKEIQTKADQRTIKAEAKVQALAAGVNPTRVDALLKLSDLSTITIGDDGEPDSNALKAAVAAALKDYPEFKAAAGNGKSGGDFSGGNLNDKPLSVQIIGDMSQEELKRRMPEVEAFFATKRK